MAETSEITAADAVVDEIVASADSVHNRSDDIPTAAELPGGVGRSLFDAAGPDEVKPPPPTPGQAIHSSDDTPPDPSPWAGADDEGPAGYDGGRR